MSNMTEQAIIYVVVGVIWLLVVLSFAIGIEKMIKVILWNYILGSICLAASQSIDFLVNFLSKDPTLKFAGLTHESLWNFFADGKTVIVLVLYVLLLVLIYRTSRIHIRIPQDNAIQNWLFILFVPLTVLSMILTLQIVVLGISVIDIQQLQTMATELTINPGIYTFITMTPVWLLLHGIATILVTSEMKVKLKTHSE